MTQMYILRIISRCQFWRPSSKSSGMLELNIFPTSLICFSNIINIENIINTFSLQKVLTLILYHLFSLSWREYCKFEAFRYPAVTSEIDNSDHQVI